jgi:CBS domain-containing protein
MLSEKDALNIYSTKSNVTVEGFTSGFPEVYPDMDIMHAAKIMVDADVGRVPVIRSGQDKTLAGILSTVDIFRNMDLDRSPKKKIEDVMTRNVISCSPKDSIAKVWLNMKEMSLSGW